LFDKRQTGGDHMSQPELLAAEHDQPTRSAPSSALKPEDVDLTDLSLFAEGPPRDAFRALRENDPVHWNPAPAEWSGCERDGAGFWSLTRAGDVAAVASDLEGFSVGRGWYLNYETDSPVPLEALQAMLTGMQPPQHTRFRALLSKAFVPKTVNRLEDLVRRRMTRIIDGVIEAGSCDMVRDVAVPLPIQVIADLLGFPEEAEELVAGWSMRLAATQDPDARGGGVEQSLRALEEIVSYSNDIADARRREPRDDLLTRLALVEIDGHRLDAAGLGSFVLQLIVAGNETTRHSLSIGLKTLMEHRRQWDLLIGSPQVASKAAEEVLRWLAPVMYMRRTAMRDVEIGGKQIHAGDKVVQWLVATNFDPELNPMPEEFDITRESIRHQTFGGGGRRFCLGAGLARLELRVGLEELSRRMPEIGLEGEPRWLRSNFFGGLLELPVSYPAGAPEAA
jgi:cholest-4-en-3-one 26-monooxygenase